MIRPATAAGQNRQAQEAVDQGERGASQRQLFKEERHGRPASHDRGKRKPSNWRAGGFASGRSKRVDRHHQAMEPPARKKEFQLYQGLLQTRFKRRITSGRSRRARKVDRMVGFAREEIRRAGAPADRRSDQQAQTADDGPVLARLTPDSVSMRGLDSLHGGLEGRESARIAISAVRSGAVRTERVRCDRKNRGCPVVGPWSGRAVTTAQVPAVAAQQKRGRRGSTTSDGGRRKTTAALDAKSLADLELRLTSRTGLPCASNAKTEGKNFRGA